MKKTNRGLRGLRWLVQLGKRFMRDDMPASSAQLTYYLTLAIFPFLVFLIDHRTFTGNSRSLIFIRTDCTGSYRNLGGHCGTG